MLTLIAGVGMTIYKRLKERRCPWCEGRGYDYVITYRNAYQPVVCPLCHGKGTLTRAESRLGARPTRETMGRTIET